MGHAVEQAVVEGSHEPLHGARVARGRQERLELALDLYGKSIVLVAGEHGREWIEACERVSAGLGTQVETYRHIASGSSATRRPARGSSRHELLQTLPLASVPRKTVERDLDPHQAGQEPMATSINDVAARAGVSVATVSRALRGLPNVAPSTRERVLAAAADLSYVADPHASRLATGRTRTIGMVVPLFTQWYFTQCLAGAEGVLAANGYDVLLYSVAGTEARKRFIKQMPFRKRVDGIIVIDLPLTDEETCSFESAQLPVVTVGSRNERFPSVTIDNVNAAMTATRHLANLGHSEIGLIASLPDDPLRFTAPLERRAGYHRVLDERGFPIRPELEAPGNFSMRGGAEAMARLLGVDQPPTAVFAESDEMAIGALKTVRDAGLRVPGDISIIGFDDHEMAEYLGLTTIAQPVDEQGEMAASMLLGLIDNASGARDHITMPTKLVVRSTTGPRRGGGSASAPGP